MELLEHLPAFAALRTHIIATIRSDYLPELFECKALYDTAKQGIDLRVMREDDLKEAIQRPLLQVYPDHGKRFEDALLEQLAHDASGDAAYLPLLQVTLEDLWARGNLKLAAYSNLTDAIQRRAADVYRTTSRLNVDQATIMEIFLDLVDVSLDHDPRRDVRRRRTVAELERGDQSRARLIDSLCDARLLSKSLETRDSAQVEVVDIIHETLIGNWKELRQAIANHRSVLQQRVRFEQALSEWQDHQYADDYLLTGVRLAEAQELDRRGDVALRSPEAQKLVKQSIAAREAVRRRQIRRSRQVAAGLVVLLLVALVAIGLVVNQRQSLQIQLNVSEAQRLAFAARVQLDGAPETGLLLASESVLRDRNPVSEQALRDALNQVTWRPIVLRGHTDKVRNAIFSPDGQRIVTASDDGTARVWGVDGPLLATLQGHNDKVKTAVFSPDGRRIVTTSDDWTARIWRTDGTLLATPHGHTGMVESAMFSPDGQRIVTASDDGTAAILDQCGRHACCCRVPGRARTNL